MKKWTIVEKRVLAIALAVGLLLRLLNWSSMSGQPWFNHLGLDAKYYDEWAQRILREGIQGHAPFFMGPLYPYLLAFLYKFAGRSLDAVRGLQIMLSVGSIALVYVLARRLAGVAEAMIAACALAVYGPIIYYSTSILFDAALPIAISLAMLLCLHEAAQKRSLRFAFAAGALLGIHALGRANILLFAPCAFFWLACAWGQVNAPSWRGAKQGWRAALVLTLGTMLFILPATIHNWRAGDPALITTNGGLNLYIGNGPMASGGHENPVLQVRQSDGSVEQIVADLHKDVECRTEAEQVVGHPLKYTEVSDFYTQETLRYLRQNPGRFLSMLLRKTYLFWSNYEIPQVEHFGYFRKFSPAIAGPVLTFGIVGPLGLVGMALSRKRAARLLLLDLYIVAFSISVIAFFVLDRYRLPIVPPLLIFAAIACTDFALAVRERRIPRAAAISGATAILMLFFMANVYHIDEKRGIAQIVYRLGIVEDARGNYENAMAHYREALRLKPEYERAHMNLGADLARTGKRSEAMEHFVTAEQLNPKYYRAPYNRGALLDELGKTADAEVAYRRSLELEPRYLLGRVSLGEMMFVKGEFDSARAEFEQVMAYQGTWQAEQNPAARARASRALDYLRETDSLRKAGIGDCISHDELFRHAEIARLRGRNDEALAILREYFEAGGQCAEAYHSLGIILLQMNELPGAEDAFQRARDAQPRLPGVHLALGQLAAMRGDADSAIRELQDERRIRPQDASPLLEIGLVHERLRRDPQEASKWFQRYLQEGGDEKYLASRRGAWKADAKAELGENRS
ncbi:MAG TPA: tetratricopeptide repeat protein [bacterium]|nr:tetratricopeptide repeat protein [bacterium]